MPIVESLSKYDPTSKECVCRNGKCNIYFSQDNGKKTVIALSNPIIVKDQNEEEEGYKFKGIALTEGTHKDLIFEAVEIRKGLDSLIGRQIRLDHSDNVRDVIGKVLSAEYIDSAGIPRIEFIGLIFDSEIADKMRLGIITDFSVGVESEIINGKPTDLKFVELSIVTDGADSNAKLLEMLSKKFNRRINMAETVDTKGDIENPKQEPLPTKPIPEGAKQTKDELQDEDTEKLKARIKDLEKQLSEKDDKKKEDLAEEDSDKEKKKDEETKMSKLEKEMEVLKKSIILNGKPKGIVNDENPELTELQKKRPGVTLSHRSGKVVLSADLSEQKQFRNLYLHPMEVI